MRLIFAKGIIQWNYVHAICVRYLAFTFSTRIVLDQCQGLRLMRVMYVMFSPYSSLSLALSVKMPTFENKARISGKACHLPTLGAVGYTFCDLKVSPTARLRFDP